MPGDPQAAALPWERYRAYLGLLARLRLPVYLYGPEDASDLVQQTLLETIRASARLEALSEGARLAYLRQALKNNIHDAAGKGLARMRKDGRIRSVEEALRNSSARAAAWLEDDEPPPGRRLEQEEQLLGLAAALAELPEDQRAAVEMKHLQGCSVADVAAAMGRTETAVGGLLRRGVARLRRILRPLP
jgi:RNA polymerase sigma-70 factor (ECF subfamily)